MKNHETHNRSINHANRLALEKSPYLLQHAGQPVDWYPWGEEAFAAARQADKPIFLSIGYAACHWCHVMSHESFEDPDTGALLNDAFICIKVDREERPDVDHVYMEVCQRMTGSGGWPLTVLLTPDKKPFFAATYLPKAQHFGRRGLREIVPEVTALWQNERERVLNAADTVTDALYETRKVRPADPADLPREEALHLGFTQLERTFDPVHAGFGSGTKFPSPHQLSFLLRYHARYGNERAQEMALKTLAAMRNGGIFDHVGLGFHRYSVDPAWQVPHFEKMLYDQAMLLVAYTEAYQATNDTAHRDTALEIAAYVLRDLRDETGGFHASEDADSEGEEGKFYTWSRAELSELLGEDTAEICRLFGVTESGNFVDPHTGIGGKNVLCRTEVPGDSLQAAWNAARPRLFEVRERRIRPGKDDKILTDWNGLMIAALAFAGKTFDRPDLLDAARAAHRFIESEMTRSDGRLLHRYRDGERAVEGNLNDYAFVAWGLLALHEADGDTAVLDRLVRLLAVMVKHFSDTAGGALFFTADDAEVVLTRFKDRHDGAIPSGNAVAFQVLTRTARLTGNDAFQKAADEIARDYAADLRSRPVLFTHFLTALDDTLALGCTGPECAIPER